MTDKEYKIYDETVSFLISDIMERTKDANEISLINFTTESHEHMTVLYAAMYAASLTDKVVDLNLGWFKYWKFRAEHKDMHKWYKNKQSRKGTIGNIDVPHMIGSVYVNVKGADIFKTGIGCIYDAYYDPKRKDKND